MATLSELNAKLAKAKANSAPQLEFEQYIRSGGGSGGTSAASSGPAKQYGGWYPNPAAGGKVQRWWGEGVWTDGAEPTPQNTSANDPVASLLQSAIDLYTGKLDEYNKKIKDFDTANPFVMDTVLSEERTKATQRLDPYYNQTLTDFLTGITTKKNRSLEDEKTTLLDLQGDIDYYEERSGLNLGRAVEKSREGASDQGLYGSGKALREEGSLREESGSQMSKFLNDKERVRRDVTLAGRRLREEDIPLEERTFNRNLTQEKSYNVESSALSEARRRQIEREFERRQFTGAPPGANPLEFLNSSYGLLGNY